MDDGEHHGRLGLDPLIIALFGIMAGALVVAAYQLCIAANCKRQRMSTPERSPNPGDRAQSTNTRPLAGLQLEESTMPRRIGADSAAQPRLVFKHTREFGEGICSVCLGEFDEGEEIRVLPECAHSFHSACVDMWLFSHSNCPLCRAKTEPPHHVIIVPTPSSGPTTRLQLISEWSR